MAENRSETVISTEHTENTEERVRDLAREQRGQTNLRDLCALRGGLLRFQTL